MTRYIYDLSQNHTVSITSTSGLYAHGDLYKTQEYFGSGWVDAKGNTFDGLDRATAKYAYSPSYGAMQVTSSTYDANTGTLGQLYQTNNPLSNTTRLTYDALGRQATIAFNDGTPTRTTNYDPDGRASYVNSSTFGTQKYFYDTDGHIVESVEPTNNGITSPTTLTYVNYPNGWRKSMTIAASAFAQNPVYSYAYRVDGLKSWEQAQAVGNSWPFTYSQTEAGRPSVDTDPVAGGGHTYAYDPYGQLGSFTTKGGTVSGYTYDAEHDALTFLSALQTYDVRGELIYSNTKQSERYHSANGYLFPESDVQTGGGGQWTLHNVAYDAFDSVATADGGAPNPGGGNVDQAGQWGFDTAGRQTSGTNYFPSPGKNGPQPLLYTRTYDVENHLVTQSSNSSWRRRSPDCAFHTADIISSDSKQYQWGPNGHPQVIVATTTYNSTVYNGTRTLHWDGESLLYTTDHLGHLDDLKIDAQADYTPQDPTFAGLTMWDRDPSGEIVAAHNVNGAQSPAAYLIYSGGGCQSNIYDVTGSFVPSSFAWNGVAPGLLEEPRADGFFDGDNTIQGVRSYDDQASAWTSPDAYAGEVNDPMSQKSYMWNRNNPVAFQDPTGYDAIQSVLIGLSAVAEQLSWGLGEKAQGAVGESGYVDHSDVGYKIGSVVGFGLGFLTGESEFNTGRVLAVSLADAANALKVSHVFGNMEHGLQGAVQTYGSAARAYAGLQHATAATLTGLRAGDGAFKEAVQFAGQAVTVTGTVIKGVVRIGSAYVPH
jgi:YD repeat-containing protein